VNRERIEAIARTVLYEGYNLYPYRPSALKNQRRWTFGSLFPHAWSEHNEGDRSRMQTECLLRGGSDAEIDVRLRFLHIVAREIGELPAPIAELPAGGEPQFRTVPRLAVGGREYYAWQEATERNVAAALPLQRLAAAPVVMPFAFPAERTVEPLRDAAGVIVGMTIRSAAPLAGRLEIAAEALADDLYRVTVIVENRTALADPQAIGREAAQRSALCSAHTLLGARRGALVSLLDPPADVAKEAALCRNEGTWPVLVGDEGDTDTMLSAPIILYDYPRIAPESPGDLFDGCEIDEILTLRILTLTEAEKREMAAADPRTRALLERTEALSAEELARLHGAFRDGGAAPDALRPALRIGDRVRLKPRAGGDIMDVVLQDQIAVVEAIERDFEDRIHVAVTIVDDPGRDLGADRMPGHRFFFAPDELAPIAAQAES